MNAHEICHIAAAELIARYDRSRESIRVERWPIHGVRNEIGLIAEIGMDFPNSNHGTIAIAPEENRF